MAFAWHESHELRPTLLNLKQAEMRSRPRTEVDQSFAADSASREHG